MITPLLAAAALLAAAPLQTVDEVADELRADPVYVDADAERALSDGEAERLREAIRSAGTAVFVAVLPASVAPDDAAAAALPGDLEDATGLAGDYAVVVGDQFRAESGAAASAAFQAARDEGTAAVLLRYIDEVAGGDGSLGAGGGAAGAGDGTDPEGGASLLPWVLIGGGGVGLWALLRSRRRREDAQRRAEVAADTQLLRAELSVLADDVLRLEPEVVIRPEARSDFEAAISRHRAASAALDYADEPVDLVRVERVVDEARYAMARTRALVQGYEPPPPPEHLQRPGRHDEPPLTLDERGTPVYAFGGPFYGGGWFGGGGGGLFSGLLLGSMLGGWGWGGWHHGGDVYVDNDGGGWGGDAGGGWGDVGGGDFGGGDIGGGDW